MKKHKRDKEDRAFSKGYQIGLRGKSKSLNPYGDRNARQSWLSGWRQGREDNWDGLTGIAGVGREPH